ncbi:MAG: hypothetical protein WCE63_10315 [Acidobacteriaceae bacterium]
MESYPEATPTNRIPYFGDPANLGTLQASQKKSPLMMGWGACTKCKCDGYVSDMQHDGHCVCGHTAADHS